MRQVSKYFADSGSCVYLSALDAIKAFDRMDHSKLIEKLCKRNIFACVINTIANWYYKLSSVVRSNGIYSSQFSVSCGVHARQSDILSPLLLFTLMT